MAFPAEPSRECFGVDLLQHHAMAGAALSELRPGLVATLRPGRWDRARLREVARADGRRETVAVVEEALDEGSRGRGASRNPSFRILTVEERGGRRRGGAGAGAPPAGACPDSFQR